MRARAARDSSRCDRRRRRGGRTCWPTRPHLGRTPPMSYPTPSMATNRAEASSPQPMGSAAAVMLVPALPGASSAAQRVPAGSPAPLRGLFLRGWLVEQLVLQLRDPPRTCDQLSVSSLPRGTHQGPQAEPWRDVEQQEHAGQQDPLPSGQPSPVDSMAEGLQLIIVCAKLLDRFWLFRSFWQ